MVEVFASVQATAQEVAAPMPGDALLPVRRQWLARSVGDRVDAATVAGMAAGLRERLLSEGRLSGSRPRRAGRR